MSERTVHQLTQDFNDLVPVARERGVARWAVHHKSDFSSRQVAEQQLDRLRQALGGEPPAAGLATPAAGLSAARKLDLPPDDFVIHGVSENWTATCTLEDGTQVCHKSVATDWFIAMSLAIAHWRKTRAVPPKSVVTVQMEKK